MICETCGNDDFQQFGDECICTECSSSQTCDEDDMIYRVEDDGAVPALGEGICPDESDNPFFDEE